MRHPWRQAASPNRQVADVSSDLRTYTVREAHELTGIAESTIRSQIDRGYLRALVPHGNVRGYRVRESERLRWLDACPRVTYR